nr:MAG TPA: chitin synthase regulator [Caudoviricetes sp.]
MRWAVFFLLIFLLEIFIIFVEISERLQNV